MDWKDKRVIVIGAARQGLALGRYLAQRGARVVMNDKKPSELMEDARRSLADGPGKSNTPINWFFGGHPISLLEGADVVCVSGGVPLDLPLVQEALHRGVPLTNDSQIFLEDCPCVTIGITGSAGKTTTTSLVGEIAKAALDSATAKPPYRKVWVGGNIGTPLLAVAGEVKRTDLVVMELSSFQLELMTRSVDIACVLNLTPNHLDRHGTMTSYIAAKRRILTHQAEDSIAVLGSDDPVAWGLREEVKGRLYSFGRHMVDNHIPGGFIDDEWVSLWDGTAATHVIRQADIPLRGWHNVENVLAACALSLAAGLPVEAMREVISAFGGVPHRLEWVVTWKGADWYNDSIATAPERVMAAIHAFETPADINRPIVLLAGGRDKNLPWEELVELIHRRVDHLIAFGEAAGKIAAATGIPKPGSKPLTVDKCENLEQAVNIAASLVEPGDIVLLSPGGTSFDQFRDFEERGEAYKRWVHNLSCK